MLGMKLETREWDALRDERRPHQKRKPEAVCELRSGRAQWPQSGTCILYSLWHIRNQSTVEEKMELHISNVGNLSGPPGVESIEKLKKRFTREGPN